MTLKNAFLTLVAITWMAAATASAADKQTTKVDDAPPQLGHPAEIAVRHSATWIQKNEPPAKGDDGRVTFTYGASMPTVPCSPLHVCEIELEPGETVIDKPHIGDAARWKVAPAVSGTGAEKTVHVIIKPTEPGLETNLVIPTDRRTYHLRLVSTKASYVPRTAFYYPDSEQKAWAAEKAEMQKEKAPVISDLPSLSVDKLNFAYKVKADKGKPKFIPLRVFDDGIRTYIQMPESVQVQDAPVIVLIGSDGSEQLVNYRLKHNTYVVDRLFDKAALISGVGSKQDRVMITAKQASSTPTPIASSFDLGDH
jgi:type IV secretion system protein VirB9